MEKPYPSQRKSVLKSLVLGSYCIFGGPLEMLPFDLDQSKFRDFEKRIPCFWQTNPTFKYALRSVLRLLAKSHR